MRCFVGVCLLSSRLRYLMFDVLLLFICVGQLQRMIGLKVLEMGGNAVIGYVQFLSS